MLLLHARASRSSSPSYGGGVRLWSFHDCITVAHAAHQVWKLIVCIKVSWHIGYANVCPSLVFRTKLCLWQKTKQRVALDRHVFAIHAAWPFHVDLESSDTSGQNDEEITWSDQYKAAGVCSTGFYAAHQVSNLILCIIVFCQVVLSTLAIPKYAKIWSLMVFRTKFSLAKD